MLGHARTAVLGSPRSLDGESFLLRLHRLLIAPLAETTGFVVNFWLGLSLLCALLIGVLVVAGPVRDSLVVQDDARQHVFWMRRFLDPELFPGDLIADYFQSVAPIGYVALYRVLAAAGLDPLFASKLLPVAIGIFTSIFSFLAFLRIFPIPTAAFVATLLLNLALWFDDDVSSATPGRSPRRSSCSSCTSC